MSTTIAPQNATIAFPVSETPEWESKTDLIRRTVAAGATEDELQVFFHQARRAGLDPLARQIYYVKRRGRGVIQVGIDGLRLIADRTNAYAGSDDAQFSGTTAGERPAQASVTVYKMVQGQKCAFSATARWDEYYPGDEQGFQWRKMPHAMLAKCAEALALRKAFPADMSGLYIHEEMQQADEPEPQPQPQAQALEEPKLEGDELRDAALELFKEPQKSSRRSAFGFSPAKWPRERMQAENMTEQQRRMITAKARERRVLARDVDRLQKAVAFEFGIERVESKAAASLFIDWLMNADERTLDRGLQAASELPLPRLSA